MTVTPLGVANGTANTTIPGAESHAEPLSGDGQGIVPENGSESQSGSEGEAPKVNKEARYRVERNEARAELATANSRIEAMQTREIEHYAAQHLADPKDLLALSGVELADLLDDDGFADPDKVRVAAAEITASRPALGVRSVAYDPTQGLGGRSAPKQKPSWAAVLKS